MINLNTLVGYKPGGIEYQVVAIHPDTYAAHQRLAQMMERYGILFMEQLLVVTDIKLEAQDETHCNPI